MPEPSSAPARRASARLARLTGTGQVLARDAFAVLGVVVIVGSGLVDALRRRNHRSGHPHGRPVRRRAER